jgi:hypothetical protein
MNRVLCWGKVSGDAVMEEDRGALTLYMQLDGSDGARGRDLL